MRDTFAPPTPERTRALTRSSAQTLEMTAMTMINHAAALRTMRTMRVRQFGSNQWTGLEQRASFIMNELVRREETVGVAETTSGGLVSAALWSSAVGPRAFKGGGIRLAYGINKEADAQGVAEARAFLNTGNAMANAKSARLRAVGMGLVYENGVEHSETGTAAHALELAHAAKFNLTTTWGVGESSVPGPSDHRRTGMPAGMGFVAIAGPTAETTGVLKVDCKHASRSENMCRFAQAALDLMFHLQSKAR